MQYTFNLLQLQVPTLFMCGAAGLTTYYPRTAMTEWLIANMAISTIPKQKLKWNEPHADTGLTK